MFKQFSTSNAWAEANESLDMFTPAYLNTNKFLSRSQKTEQLGKCRINMLSCLN